MYDLPKKLSIMGKSYVLDYVTGEVLASKRHTETNIEASGGAYNQPVNVNSSTTVYDTFFIVDNDGREYSFNVSGFNVEVRQGNKVSVIRANKKTKTNGICLFIYNHSTGKAFFNHDWLWMRSRNLHWLLYIILPICGFNLGTALFEAGVLSNSLVTQDGFERFGKGLMFAIGFAVLAGIIDIVGGRIKQNLFAKSSKLQRVIDAVSKYR